MTGVSSFARVQDGAYVDRQNSLLTYVAQVDPIWVNFSISENDLLQFRSRARRVGELRLPPKDELRGRGGARRRQRLRPDRAASRSPTRITTSRPARSCCARRFPNPEGRAATRPVRARAGDGRQSARTRSWCRSRPCCRAPRDTSCRGRQGKQGADPRRAGGPWYGDEWFITQGLAAGDIVVVDGVVRLSPGAPVKIVEPGAPAPPAQPRGTRPTRK